MGNNLVTVTANENPKIELTIATYTNKISVNFTHPIDVALSIHNNDENAHSNILVEKADISFAVGMASSMSIVLGG